RLWRQASLKEFPRLSSTLGNPARSRLAATPRFIVSASAPCASQARASGARPEDRPETLRTLKRVPELGIVHRRRRLLWPGRRGAESDRACLGAEAQSSDAADSRHLEGQAPRGERRGSRHPTERRGICCARPGRAEYATA